MLDNQITVLLRVYNVSPPPQIAPDGTAIYSCSEINRVPTKFVDALSKTLQHAVNEGILGVSCNISPGLDFNMIQIQGGEEVFDKETNDVLSTAIVADVNLTQEQTDKAVEILCFCFRESIDQDDIESPLYGESLSTEEELLIGSKLQSLLISVTQKERTLNNPIILANYSDERYVLSGQLPSYTASYSSEHKFEARITIDGYRKSAMCLWIEKFKAELDTEIPVPRIGTALHLKELSLLDGLDDECISNQQVNWYKATIEVLKDRISGSLQFSIIALEQISSNEVLDDVSKFELEP